MMSEIVLSKLQFVVSGLVYNSGLFTQEDMAHLSLCEIRLANIARGENALIANVNVYFKNWSSTEHKWSDHPADAMPDEILVAFLQDNERKLTGEVRVGFFAEDPVFKGQLEYLKGW